jgi:single-stranded DNA-binding protein
MSGIDCAFLATVHRCEQKTSAAGTDYLRISVRVGDGDGAQWVSIMAFDPEALAASERLVQGARVYVEGKLSMSEWTGNDGTKRQGLSVMSWHCRLPHIGRNRPKRDKPAKHEHGAEPTPRTQGDRTFYSDEVPF